MRTKIHLSLVTISLALSLGSTNLQAQENDSVKIASLQQRVNLLTELLEQKDSLAYVEQRENIMNGFHNSYILNGMIRELEKEIINEQNTIALLNLNNPGTSQLISQFESFLKKIITDKLSSVLGNSDKKSKILATLDNIFKNPVIAPILHSNPVSATISSAYNFVSGLLEPNLKVEKTFTGIVKNASLELNNVIDNSFLGELTQQVVPYIRFFDTLFVLNTRFNSRLTVIRNQAKALAQGYQPIWKFYTSLGIDQKSSPVEKQKLFEQNFPPVTGRNRLLAYNEFLQKPANRIANDHSLAVREFYTRYNELVSNYNEAMEEFKSQYIAVLSQYKTKLSLYTNSLENSYAQLTKEPEVVSQMIVNSNPGPGNKNIDPLEEKAIKAQWRYDWVDLETRTSLEKIF